MPKKKSKKKSGSKYRIRKPGSSSGDLVTIQFSIKLKKVPVGFKMTQSLADSLIRRKASLSVGTWDGTRAVGCKAGPNPPGIELTITRWSNPERRGRGSAWRYPVDSLPVGTGQDEAWGTLRLPIGASSGFHNLSVIR